VIVTVAEADLVVSACDTALTVTVAGLGTLAGAVYRPAELMVPTVASPPATSLTLQLTAVLVVFRTVAVNWVVLPTGTVAAVGEMVMETAGGGGVPPSPPFPPHDPKDTTTKERSNTAVLFI
jgi:hypothetical protein